MSNRSVPAILAVVGLALAGACGGDDGPASDDTTDTSDAAPPITADGERFEVGVGERFVVVLESNASTGYAWAPEVDPPRDLVRLVGDEYVDPATELVGAPGRQVLTFEAVGEGSTVLQLWYVRAFDDPPVPADRAEFEVVAGDATADGSAADADDSISVAELLASAPEGEVLVTGVLFDDGSGLVLCDVLAESYPPQCVGDRVPIADPDAPIPGVAAGDLTEAEGVRWTDRPVTVRGFLDGGLLVVVVS